MLVVAGRLVSFPAEAITMLSTVFKSEIHSDCEVNKKTGRPIDSSL